MQYRAAAIFTASLAFVMMLVLAGMANAQAQGRDVNLQYIDCSQVQSVAAEQGQYGNATANANRRDAQAEAVLEVAQDLNISQEQVNACLGDIDLGDNNNNNDDDTDDNDQGRDDAAETVLADDVIPGTIAADILPDTGGFPILPAAGVTMLLAVLLGWKVIRR